MRNRAPKAAAALIPAGTFFLMESVSGNLLSLRGSAVFLSLMLCYLLYGGILLLSGNSRWSFPLLTALLYVFALTEYFVIGFRERPAMIWDVLALKTAMTVSANYKYVITPRLVITGVFAVSLMAVGFCFPLRICGLKKERGPEDAEGFARSYREGQEKDTGKCQKKDLRTDQEKSLGTGAEKNQGKGRKKSRRKCRGILAAVWAGSCGVYGALLFCVFSPRLGLEVHMWDPIVSFEQQGILLSTVLSMKTLIPEAPKNYSAEEAETLLKELEEPSRQEDAAPEVGTAATSLPTNVICIMNESFSDLRRFNGLTAPERTFETDKEFLSYFDGLSENVQKGNLYVPVFGAMTANSEYEFLTGNSCALMPQGSIPYQFYVKPGQDSLARIFHDYGYRTVAMHPYPGYNWNRTEAYANMGFDEFLDLEYYETLGKEMELFMPRGYMSDRSDYDGIIWQLEKKAPGEKLFLFNVTMQNHGGYEVAGLESQVHVTRLLGEECRGEYPKADQYLTLMKMSDEALRYLLEYCEGLEEPTMVVLFGDHQPSVETTFFEALYGAGWSAVSEKNKLNSFVTPYLIWTNYDRSAGQAGDMSAFMLGNQVLLEAGIRPLGQRAQIEAVRERFAAVHSMGTLDREGTFVSILDMESLDEEPVIGQLHILQYYSTFEEKQ